MATVTKPAPATPGVFDLSDEHVAAIAATGTRGRAQQPSPYLDAVREALKTGAKRGVQLVGKTEDEVTKHARKVGNDLRKAGLQLTKELGLDSEVVRVTTATRTDHPKLPPFVGFTVTRVPKSADTPADTTSAS